MSLLLRQYIIKCLITTIIIVIFACLIFVILFPKHYVPIFPYLLAFMFVSSIAVHAYQLRLIRKDIASFARSNMLITFIKLFVYSIIAIIYIAQFREKAIVFVICLMSFYVVYSILEIVEITRILRSK